MIVVVTELGRSPAGASGSQLPGYIYIYIYIDIDIYISRRIERQCTTCQAGSTGHVKHRFQLLSGLSHALAVASTVIVVDGGVNEDEKSNRP